MMDLTSAEMLDVGEGYFAPRNIQGHGDSVFEIGRRLGGGRIAEVGVFSAQERIPSGEKQTEVAVKIGSASHYQDLQGEAEFLSGLNRLIASAKDYKGALPPPV